MAIVSRRMGATRGTGGWCDRCERLAIFKSIGAGSVDLACLGCGDRVSACFDRAIPDRYCALVAGHEGPHESCYGSQWGTFSPVATTTTPELPNTAAVVRETRATVASALLARAEHIGAQAQQMETRAAQIREAQRELNAQAAELLAEVKG